jgi:hypothetical protein
VAPHQRDEWTGQRWACAAGSYEVTPSDRQVSGECPTQADGSTSGQSERTSAGFKGVRPGSGTHPNADQFSIRGGGPSTPYPILAAGYVGQRRKPAGCERLPAATIRAFWARPAEDVKGGLPAYAAEHSPREPGRVVGTLDRKVAGDAEWLNRGNATAVRLPLT